MKEELQKLLFNRDYVESELYYISGTVVLSIAIIGLILITIYSIVRSVRSHKNANYLPKEFKNYRKISLAHSLLVVLSSFFTFIISFALFPEPLVTGWGEDLGMIIFFPFIAAVFFGEIGKSSRLKKKGILQGLSFWRVYSFVFCFVGLRILAFYSP